MMPQDRDDASIALELREVADSLRTRLKLLGEAGLSIVPFAGATALRCPEGPVVMECWECGPGEFAAISPCPLHASWEGAIFGCWEIADSREKCAAVIWGAPVSVKGQASERPLEAFRPEEMEQFLRMLEWLSGELDAPQPGSYRIIASGKCLESGRISAEEAASAAAAALERRLSAIKPGAVLLMGRHAVRVFSQKDEAPGKPFEKNGLVFMATYSPEEMLKSGQRKKEAHGHLKGFIRAVRP